MRPTWIRRLAGITGVAGVALAAPVFATDYVVNTVADVVDANDQLISLREAVQAASTNAPAGNAPAGDADGDTITIGGVPYPLDPANGPLEITDDVVITGSMGSNVNGLGGDVQLFTIDADGETVAFDSFDLVGGTAVSGGAIQIAAGSTVTLNNVNVTDNLGTGDAATNGGAIDNAGTLTITGGSLTGNVAGGVSGSGGAIINSGTLTVTDASFSNNNANRAGGAIEQRTNEASMTLNNVTADSNEVFDNPGNGGFLHISQAGGADINMGSFTSNTAANEGGALWNGGGLMTVDGATITDNIAAGVNAFEGGGGIFNQGGTLTITNTTIDDNSATGTSGSGGGIFNNAGGTLSVTGGSISGNSAQRAGGGIEDRSLDEMSPPAALSPAGSVTLTNVTLNNNGAGNNPGNGGGLHATGPTVIDISGATITGNAAAREGGGLWNGSGPMSIADSTISNNAANGDAADDGGGGIFNQGGVITITGADTIITDNAALGVSGSGGGIFNNEGQVFVTDASITANIANRAGGGIEDRSTTSVPNAANPTISLTNVTLDGNSAGVQLGGTPLGKTGAVRSQGVALGTPTPNPGNGGGLHITGDGGGVNGGYVIVTGGTVNGNLAALEGGGLWNFGAPSELVVDGTTLNSNVANGEAADTGGGALFNNGGIMTVSNATMMMNTATEGSGSGGAVLSDGGTLDISLSTMSGNTSARAGGAIEVRGGATTTLTDVTMDDNETGPSPGNGGGMHVSGENATTTISRSTVSNNVAANEGGGLWNFDNSDMRVWNSTIWGNTANGAPGGGGIFNRPASRTTTLNVTIASNSASAGPGGGVANADATADYQATNTLIGDNTAASNNDVSGTVGGDGYNLVEDITGATLQGTNNVTGMDAGLSMDGLALNGGPTQTVALGAGSPAIDAGLNSTCTSMAIGNVDQRGIGRTADCDIGAYEVTDNPVATVGGNGNSAGGAGGGTPAPVTVDAGATDVPALGFGVTAPSSEALTVTGFSGTFSGNGNVADVSLDVVLDANGNGVADSGEEVIPATVSLTASSFTATFTTPRTVAAGTSENYILAADFNATLSAMAMPMLAGGSLLLLGLAGVAGFGRRKQLLIVGVVLAGASLAGCSGDSTLTRVDGGTFQFTLTNIAAQGAITGDAAVPSGLPLAGPVINVNR